jgi:hypothetical protein
MDGTRKKQELTDMNLKGRKRWSAQNLLLLLLLPLKAPFNVSK